MDRSLQGEPQHQLCSITHKLQSSIYIFTQQLYWLLHTFPQLMHQSILSTAIIWRWKYDIWKYCAECLWNNNDSPQEHIYNTASLGVYDCMDRQVWYEIKINVWDEHAEHQFTSPSVPPVFLISKMFILEDQNLCTGAHILLSSCFLIDQNLCVESDMCNFQVLFCVYTVFKNEAPGLFSSSPQGLIQINGSLTDLCRPGWQADSDPFI